MTRINHLVANIVAMAGLLSGAAIVHNIFKPDLVWLTLPIGYLVLRNSPSSVANSFSRPRNWNLVVISHEMCECRPSHLRYQLVQCRRFRNPMPKLHRLLPPRHRAAATFATRFPDHLQKVCISPPPGSALCMTAQALPPSSRRLHVESPRYQYVPH